MLGLNSVAHDLDSENVDVEVTILFVLQRLPAAQTEVASARLRYQATPLCATPTKTCVVLPAPVSPAASPVRNPLRTPSNLT